MSKWWQNSVVYQIYPRSFKDSNGDGIGDINGITGKLDYLRDLGVDVLWLSPVYQSPGDDNGYDISDYEAINPEFGTMADFEQLLSEAHQRKLKIVMDLVVNHSSDEHRWFQESRRSKDNPYRDWYIWKPAKNGGPPNNWGSVFGGSAWAFDELSGEYYLHSFSPKQPDLNWENPAVRTEIYAMMRRWCERGIDGFRMDVITMISKDQRFPDGVVHEGSKYGDFGPYCIHGPRIHEFLQEMNREVLSSFDLLTVGECGGITPENAPLYAGLDGRELDMFFQFEHVDSWDPPFGKWTEARFDFIKHKKIFFKWQNAIAGRAWMALFLSNHDQPRMVSRFGNDEPQWRERSAKLLALSVHLFRGTPYLYEGDELGMSNVPFADIGDYRDIEAKNAWRDLVETGLIPPEQMLVFLGLRSRDHARTPMQWDVSTNAGFSEAEPWIMVNPNFTVINAAEQVARPDSVYNFYKRLIALRKAEPILVDGDVRPQLEEHPGVFAWRRVLGDKSWQFVSNWTAAEIENPLQLPEASSLVISNVDGPDRRRLQAYEASVWEIRG